MWTQGVVLESEEDDLPGKKYKWYCLTNDDCKKKKSTESLGQVKASSNPVKHLRNEHGMESDRTKDMCAAKQRREKSVNEIRSSNIYRNDEMKAVEFSYALLVIRCMLPHCLVENEAWRQWAAVACKPSINLKMHAAT